MYFEWGRAPVLAREATFCDWFSWILMPHTILKPRATWVLQLACRDSSWGHGQAQRMESSDVKV